METIIHRPLNSIWLKASVLGSFWAAVEIILGSFLHNLKIPLSGTLLSFISVYLIISFFQIWKENGLIIRAGLVCALMKSISPSAIIIGPMIGILTEAVLLEFIIWGFGKNLLAYTIGGAFAVLSSLLHKLFSLIILYGLDFIKILSSLYQFAVKQIHLSSPDPLILVILISLIYMVAGVSAAIAGYITGKRYQRNNKIIKEQPGFNLQTDNQLFKQTTNRSYSIYYLLLNICAVIISLLLINYEVKILSVIFPALYLGFSIYHYKSSLNRFKKISVWIQFALITVIAAFLLNGFSERNFFTISGLIIGLKMITRAIVIIIGFATISIELKNPLIKSVLYKKGFANLYQSLTLAFSALPYIISTLPDSKLIFSKSKMFFSHIFSQANLLLTQLERTDLSKPEIIIISGEKHSGKTTFVKNIVENLQLKKIQVTGFLSLGIHEKGSLTGFKVFDVQTSEETKLCTKIRHENWLNFGDYYFSPEGIAKGIEILGSEYSQKQLFVIDEIGPLELKGEGWSSSIDKLCDRSTTTQLWVVRQSLVNKVIKRWNTGNVYIFDISKDSLIDAENKILEIIQKKADKANTIPD